MSKYGIHQRFIVRNGSESKLTVTHVFGIGMVFNSTNKFTNVKICKLYCYCETILISSLLEILCYQDIPAMNL